FDALLLLMPKAKAEAQYLLAMMTPLLEAGADLFLAGENRGGINGAEKLLAPYGEKPIKHDSARRCSLYHGELCKQVAPFDLDNWFGRYQCKAGDTELTVLALPGVFSAAELDLGSQMLLATVPAMKGSLLDFGCGAGVIGSVLAKRNPDLQVNMVDISALALESSRRTLAINGLEGKVYPSDVYSDVATRFQHIVSNPPFHAGLKTFYAATEQFLARAPEFLLPTGSLTIVANAFLRYQPILETHFKRTEVISSDAKFKVYLSKI
ncbi:MAG: 16S rRNA (guanine(1207)-N(2))-methyltransferase RsmC, partial [Aeromonas sp.]